MSTTSPWRSAFAVRLFLVAALAAAAFLGAYGLFSPTDSTTAGRDGTVNGSQVSDPTNAEVASFVSADAGACLNWDINADGSVSNFSQTPCDKPHRFEVSARQDLGTYPTSEFGPKAARPDVTRQNALRDELCAAPTLSYLDGAWDPNGRFDVASILPPEAAWASGDRTLLCGLQTTDANGVPQQTSGKVAEVDQAVVAKQGECQAIDEQQVMRTVDCSKPHQLETVSVVNLAEHYPDGYPAPEDLDSYLSSTCTEAAIEYLGSEENLYQSTLQPFWGALSKEAWDAGTRSVNCSLMHPNEGSFSEIIGSATGGREALTINGAPPTEQPKRNPLRTPSAQAPAPNPAADQPEPTPAP
ncbi:septum formation family protein [Corynebacterium sp.]|uniref:septum formation family protein n=1 Tax=Corynebacterium sp. TaxID=1720 RepID=UPI0026DB0D6F|nr:septum formation family protein [Corynebacterium sp.]MDO5032972.1 septum formation family protein [Corynebacterium sp.]